MGFFDNLISDGSYRRALTEEEIPPQFRNVFGDRAEPAASVRAMENFGDFVPGYGDVVGVMDLAAELSKENPNYPLAAALGVGSLVGLVPGAGDVVQRGIVGAAERIGEAVPSDVKYAGRSIAEGDLRGFLDAFLPGGEAQSVGAAAVDDLPDLKITEAPRITPSDLEGARIIPTVADLTRAGDYYTGIDASKIDVPEPMLGGPGFPLLQSSIDENMAWAVNAKGIGTKKAGKGADLIAVSAMNPDSHKSNISFINSLNKTTAAYVRDGRISDDTIKMMDDAIRGSADGGDPALQNLSKFPGFKSPNVNEFIENASFEQRKRISDIIATKRIQEAGAPNVNRVLQETVAPEYAGANPRDTLLFIQPDANMAPVDLVAEGLTPHPSYKYGIPGKVYGVLDQPISTFETFPTFWNELGINEFGTAFNKGGRRKFDMELPVEEVTGDQVRRMEGLMTMDAAMSRLSPIDTRIITNSLAGNWKTSLNSVKQGGLSPQGFADAISNNKYSPALTNYTKKDIDLGRKNGTLEAFQLGDDDVYFAIDKVPDYSWAGVDMLDGDKALVGVVSNAPGSKGTAAPSVLAKALEEGVTVLDAFAVPSKRFKDGFLPEYYSEFGFEEVGRVPFDKKMYIDEHGEQAYADLLDAWKSDGWDESMGMPPVVVMRWNGKDAERTAAAAKIRGTDTSSSGGQTFGLVSEAEGSSGQLTGQTASEGAANIGRTDTREIRDDNRVRLSSGARKAGAGILSLTDEQLKNRGINPSQVAKIKTGLLE